MKAPASKPMANHIQATAAERVGKHQRAKAGQERQAPEKVRATPVARQGEPAQLRCMAWRSAGGTIGASSRSSTVPPERAGKQPMAKAGHCRQAPEKMRSLPVAMQGAAGVVLVVADGVSMLGTFPLRAATKAATKGLESDRN